MLSTKKIKISIAALFALAAMITTLTMSSGSILTNNIDTKMTQENSFHINETTHLATHEHEDYQATKPMFVLP